MGTYILSVPPSANAMYHNIARGRRKTRKYQAWIKGEMNALMAQRAKPVEGCATVTISLPKIRGDADNRIKPTLDLLVRAGVLKDDNAKYVCGISVNFHNDSPMMRVEITTCAKMLEEENANS